MRSSSCTTYILSTQKSSTLGARLCPMLSLNGYNHMSPHPDCMLVDKDLEQSFATICVCRENLKKALESTRKRKVHHGREQEGSQAKNLNHGYEQALLYFCVGFHKQVVYLFVLSPSMPRHSFDTTMLHPAKCIQILSHGHCHSQA